MSQSTKEITASEAWEKLRQGETCQIVDVRETDEYSAGHIAGSTSMPLSALDLRQASSVDKDKTLFLLCKAGGRARKAADIFMTSGVQNIAVIDGGILAWIEAGYPVEQG
jgi:rhodanese-related sulfurtransferase